MTKKYTGTVHGNTIQLDESSGLTDGERVNVSLESQSDSEQPSQKQFDQAKWKTKMKKLAGVLSDLPDSVDRDMEEILADRKATPFREGS